MREPHPPMLNVIHRRSWRDRFCARLAEPIHLNLVSAFVAACGSYRSKVDFDLIRRRHYAYCTLTAADLAKQRGLQSVTVTELGVASGDGMLNLCEIARNISPLTGIEIKVVGFDSGGRMPPPRDYRDHPDLYQAGDFQKRNMERLRSALPSNAELILGEFRDTVPRFARRLSPSSPLGFAAIDIDYYSSAVEALSLFANRDPEKYLPTTLLYLDDINQISNSRFTGELLAVEEFNAAHLMRKIDRHQYLRGERIFKNAAWIDQIFVLHVLDHPVMQPVKSIRPPKVYSDAEPRQRQPLNPADSDAVTANRTATTTSDSTTTASAGGGTTQLFPAGEKTLWLSARQLSRHFF